MEATRSGHPGPVARRAFARSHVVWATLLASMTTVGALLLASERGQRPGALPPAVELARPAGATIADILDTPTPLDRDRWQGIVIHHSGAVSGSPESIAAAHESQGLRGLGYHFIISNGRGAPDGEIHVGFRWSQQLPGAHALGSDADWYNRHTVGICLVGDGDTRGFTELQLQRLAELVDAIQQGCDISDAMVVLHRDIAPTTSPGRLFPGAALRARLADTR